MIKEARPAPAAPFELLPAIDLRGGRVVRLRQGDFGRETVYDLDPVDVARSFDAAGATWLHVVDLDGARAGERRQAETVEAIVAAVGRRMRCEVAGGLRDEAAIEAVLASGVSRAVVGTAALRDPGFAARLVSRFGAERVAVALDVRDGLAVGGGWLPDAAGVPAVDALTTLHAYGVRTFIVTSIARDGLLGGPDLELLHRLVGLGLGEVVASGGVTSIDDVEAVRRLGCSGAIVGRALYEGKLDLGVALAAVRSAGRD